MDFLARAMKVINEKAPSAMKRNKYQLGLARIVVDTISNQVMNVTIDEKTVKKLAQKLKDQVLAQAACLLLDAALLAKKSLIRAPFLHVYFHKCFMFMEFTLL